MYSIRNVRFTTLMSLVTGMLVGCGAQDEIDPSLEDDFSASPGEQIQKGFEDETWDNLLRLVHIYKKSDFRGESRIYKEDVRKLSLPFTFRYILDDDYKDAVDSINLKQRCMMTLFADDKFNAAVQTYGGQNSRGGALRNYPPRFHAFEIKCWDKTRAYGTLHTSLDGNGDYYYLFSTYSDVPPSFGPIKSIRVNQTTYGSGASAMLLTVDPPSVPPRPVDVVTTVTRNQNLNFESSSGIQTVQVFNDYFGQRCEPRPSCYLGPSCTGEKLTNLETGGPPSDATICWAWASRFTRYGAPAATPSYCTRDGLCINPASGSSSRSELR